ncbi:beta-fructofuranosidase insoluble isoenzyme cwinv1 [Phtheirospermum japonicum]|uniref:Beta-fructofuranosidase insoluble isoenzyme cwinv1 n=1 Tax=Phtheirospermum japonicum TaxID=374723 RepID=A0A830CHZ7_9LAMI|nr:beta-fructofuranosidase insoluble isoenzyme cwinv1 [Phtheirospermum japonicum]
MTPTNGLDPKNYRDPTTAWRASDDTWRVLIGSRIDGHGAAVLYKSKDFIKWERTKTPLHASNKTGMWECPDFYPVGVDGEKNGLDTSDNGVGVRHVLKASFNDHDYYVIGSYDSKTDGFSVDVDFMDERVRLRYDYGVFYASKTFYDGAKKRRVLWGWVLEADSESDDVGRGWSGLQSIPRSILLDKNRKQLIQWPIKELNKLRGKKVTVGNKEIKSGEIFQVSGITASQADVEVSFRLPNLEGVELINSDSLVDPRLLCSQMNASANGVFGPFGLLVLASEDLTEKTAVFFRIFKSDGKYVVLMCSDQSSNRSSLKTHVKEAFFGSFLDVDLNQEISLRTLIDHSIVESFGGKGKSCITARVYPNLAISKNSHIYAFNNGKKSVTISSLSAWSMKKAQIAQAHRRRKPSIS